MYVGTGSRFDPALPETAAEEEVPPHARPDQRGQLGARKVGCAIAVVGAAVVVDNEATSCAEAQCSSHPKTGALLCLPPTRSACRSVTESVSRGGRHSSAVHPAAADFPDDDDDDWEGPLSHTTSLGGDAKQAGASASQPGVRRTPSSGKLAAVPKPTPTGEKPAADVPPSPTGPGSDDEEADGGNEAAPDMSRVGGQ